MKTLDLTDAKIKKFDEVEDRALNIIRDVLAERREVDDTANMAIKAWNVVAKTRQTLTNRTAIGFSMASSIGTPEQLKNYITITNPQVQKALTGKSG